MKIGNFRRNAFVWAGMFYAFLFMRMIRAHLGVIVGACAACLVAILMLYILYAFVKVPDKLHEKKGRLNILQWPADTRRGILQESLVFCIISIVLIIASKLE